MELLAGLFFLLMFVPGFLFIWLVVRLLGALFGGATASRPIVLAPTAKATATAQCPKCPRPPLLRFDPTNPVLTCPTCGLSFNGSTGQPTPKGRESTECPECGAMEGHDAHDLDVTCLSCGARFDPRTGRRIAPAGSKPRAPEVTNPNSKTGAELNQAASIGEEALRRALKIDRLVVLRGEVTFKGETQSVVPSLSRLVLKDEWSVVPQLQEQCDRHSLNDGQLRCTWGTIKRSPRHLPVLVVAFGTPTFAVVGVLEWRSFWSDQGALNWARDRLGNLDRFCDGYLLPPVLLWDGHPGSEMAGLPFGTALLSSFAFRPIHHAVHGLQTTGVYVTTEDWASEADGTLRLTSFQPNFFREPHAEGWGGE